MLLCLWSGIAVADAGWQRNGRSLLTNFNNMYSPCVVETGGEYRFKMWFFGWAPIPVDMQGKSLLPQLTDPSIPIRDSFFKEHLYGHADEAPNHIERSEGVRTRRWKYINYIDQSGPLSEELYDLRNDPLELNNLAHGPEYKQQLRKLQRQWENFRNDLK